LNIRGISIDCSHENENAFDSIRINREFDSNEIDESDLQSEKYDDPIFSNEPGIHPRVNTDSSSGKVT
jgi:hypothetical protein